MIRLLGGGNRARSDYLAPVLLHHLGTVENPLNADERFPGFRPRGFEIGQDKQPVMAIVALEPSRLDPGIDAASRAAYIEEVKELRLAVTSDDRTARQAAAGRMSSGLREILSSCLLANDTFISSQNEDGSTQEWELPFDLIASLKALYTLLSGEGSSATMRQGAIRASNPNGQEIIVGCSGLNSAIDEMVARNFASDVLNVQRNRELALKFFPWIYGRERTILPGEYGLVDGTNEPAQIREGQIRIITNNPFRQDPFPGVYDRGLYTGPSGKGERIVSFLYHKRGPDGQFETVERAIIFRGIGFGEHPGHRRQPPTWYLVGPQIGTLDHKTGAVVTMPDKDMEIPAKHFSMACITDGPLSPAISAN